MKVFLYCGLTEGIDIGEIESYLTQKLPDLDVEVKDKLPLPKRVAKRIAQCRVKNPYSKNININPLPGEIRYEEKLLEDPDKGGGVLYHGSALCKVLASYIPSHQLLLKNLHLFFTKRFIASWGEDARYHVRVCILSSPSIISTSGVVEGPARPREFYAMKERLGKGAPPEVVRERINKDFLVQDDPRLTEVLKGYTLQAVSYRFIGEAFCEKSYCRLYNAHYQQEMIKAQLQSPELCKKHAQIFG